MLERIMQQPMQKAIENGNQELSSKLIEIRQKLSMQAEKNHKIERDVEDYVVKTKFANELAERLKEKAAENGEQFDKGKEEKEEKEEQKNESEEESSYYDTEEDDENEEVKKEDQENRNIANFIEKKATGVSKPVKDIEDSEMI